MSGAWGYAAQSLYPASRPSRKPYHSLQYPLLLPIPSPFSNINFLLGDLIAWAEAYRRTIGRAHFSRHCADGVAEDRAEGDLSFLAVGKWLSPGAEGAVLVCNRGRSNGTRRR